MMELLQSHAVRCDEFGRLWGLVDANGVEVATLAEADPAVIEAVGWLQERELCEVIKDPHGEAVVLLEVDEPMVS
ncbi:MAG: hypothetical protein BroJett038_23760 [Chloroflexota bacterium]|jgi:hypothetical protein|nr:MAG: hypothetical protein BroJett038_23760 [Chloroflexota bacterium]